MRRLAVAVLLVATPVLAAEPCRPIGDPAFGRPTDCRPPAPRTAKPTTDSKGEWKTTPDGDRVFQFGDTTIRTSGSVQVDFVTGHAGRVR
ncbi:MAG: hypothetical protein LWW93_05455 [Hyphomicrobiales bacterium]|nr:hypothetical protein [Hyphomicrobiales bacterium]